MTKNRLALVVTIVAVFAVLPYGAAGAADTMCGEPYTPIYDIQGSGDLSPEDGNVVTTEGVVTVSLQASENEIRGFFIQDPKGDGDASTSDGVFVYHSDSQDPAFVVEPGDYVRVTGEVDEQFKGSDYDSQGDNPYYRHTQIEYVSAAEHCGSDKVKALKLDMADYRDDAEKYEGMLVGFEKKMVVTDTYNLTGSGEIYLAEKSVVPHPTDIYPASSPKAAALAEASMDRVVFVDDGIRYPNPHDGRFYTNDGVLRLGDELHKFTGAVWFDYNAFRVVPDEDSIRVKERNKRQSAPSARGDIVVGSMNVENYWSTLGSSWDHRGAESPEQFAVQTEKLVAALLGLDADILALQEIENEFGHDLTTTPDHTPILTLLAALNAADDDEWAWVGEAPEGYNNYPIRNEILYKVDEVTPIGAPIAYRDDVFDVYPGKDGAPGRSPFAQTFEADNGEVFTVMVNHLKSKSCSDAAGLDEDQGDGQSCYNDLRTQQADAILDFVDMLINRSNDPDVLVVGDMNAYMEEDPIHALESGLKNLVERYDKKHYSYNFFASFAAPWIGRGTIDHAFATGSLKKQVKSLGIWHINGDEPNGFGWESYEDGTVTDGPYRSSDHDPIIIGLKLR